MKILLKNFSFLLVAGVMAGCSKNDDENGGGSNWKPNLGDYDPVPLSDFDNGFYKWCVGKFDATGDGILQYGEIKTIEEIVFYMEKEDINSLKGIKYFTSLRFLEDYNGWTCSDITELDLSHNLMLDSLRLGNKPKLRSLILGDKPYLKYLGMGSSLITSLDNAKCPKLKYLDMTSHHLISLDMTKNTLLEVLYCSSESITSVDVSTCKQLKELSIYNYRGSLKTLYVWKGWTKQDFRWSYGYAQIIEK